MVEASSSSTGFSLSRMRRRPPYGPTTHTRKKRRGRDTSSSKSKSPSSPPLPKSFVNETHWLELAALEQRFFSDEDATAERTAAATTTTTTTMARTTTNTSSGSTTTTSRHFANAVRRTKPPPNDGTRERTRWKSGRQDGGSGTESDDDDDDDDELLLAPPVFHRCTAAPSVLPPPPQQTTGNQGTVSTTTTTTTIVSSSSRLDPSPGHGASVQDDREDPSADTPAVPPSTSRDDDTPAVPVATDDPVNNQSNSRSRSSSSRGCWHWDTDQDFLRAVSACYYASDPTTVTSNEVIRRLVSHVNDLSTNGSSRSSHTATARTLLSKERKALLKEHVLGLARQHQRRKELSPRRMEQDTMATKEPSPPPTHEAALFHAVDQVFASVVAAKRLDTWTVQTFVTAVQAKLASSATFDASTKSRVKERVTQLLQERHPQQSSSLQVTHGRCTPLATTTTTTTTTAAATASSESNNKENVGSNLPHAHTGRGSGARCRRTTGQSTEKRRTGANPSKPTMDAPSITTTEVEPSSKETLDAKMGEIDGTRLSKKSGNDTNVVDDDVEVIELESTVPPSRRRRPKAFPSSKDGVARRKAIPQKSTKPCGLCSKCPCQFRDRESSGSSAGAFHLAQSDVAIEKALMRRLLKLERTTDQHEEQAEAVRRRLKKHRRDIWKKRNDLLKTFEKSKVAGKDNSSLSFLPDVEDFQKNEPNRKKVPDGRVAKVTDRMFPTKKRASFQPTLTQLMGEPSAPEKAPEMGPEHEPTGSESLNGSALGDEHCHASDCGYDKLSDDDIRVKTKTTSGPIPSPSPGVARRIDSNSTFVGSATCTGSTSLWDAIRKSEFDSLWDQLFEEESNGVDDLLDLFAVDNPRSPVRSLRGSSSCKLKQTESVVVDSLIHQVASDTARASTLKLVCPNWQENVAFAMGQTDKTILSEALFNVQESREKINRAKAVLKMQEVALGVFEETLQASLARFPVDNEEQQAP